MGAAVSSFAVTFRQSQGSVGPFGTPRATGLCLVADIMWESSGGSITVTDSAGNTWAQVFASTVGTESWSTWVALNAAASTFFSFNTVTATCSATMAQVSMAIHEYSNITAVDVFTVGHGGLSGPMSMTATTAHSIDTLHCFVASSFVFSLPTPTPIGDGSNWALRQNVSGFIMMKTFDQQVSLADTWGITFGHFSHALQPTVFGCILALKTTGSPLSPGTAWLMINDPDPAGLTDRSSYLHFGSEQSFSQILRQRGTARVTLRVSSGDPYTPIVGSQVFLYDQNIAGHTMVFAGTIDVIELTWLGSLGDRLFSLTVVSFEQAFDALLVPPQTFNYELAEDIFSQLLTSVAGGVPVIPGVINAPFPINSLSTDWSRLSEIFNQLASASTCTWGVDLATLTVYLKPISTTASPFTLQSNQVIWGSNKWSQNRQDYRNRQIIRISIDAFAQSAELFAYTGVPQSFALLRPAEEITNAWFTNNRQNTATGTFTDAPANGDTITIGYPQTGSIYNWAPNAPYYTGQIIIDPSNHIQACTQGNSPGAAPTSLSGSSQPSWDDTGGTTSDLAIVWTDKGLSGAGGIGSSVYTFVDELDNTQWGQVLRGANASEAAWNFRQAINSEQSNSIVGNVYSWPTWENPIVNADDPGSSGVITVRNKSAGAGYIAALSTTSGVFSWSAAETGGGSTALGTISLQVSAQGSSNSANIYYTPGSVTVSLASRPTGVPSSGGFIQIQYKRAASDCIVVEDTQETFVRAAVENGTGKYQQIVSDTSNTSNTSGLQKAQAALAAFKQIPISFSFRAFRPGLAPGQLLAISFAGDPVGINTLVNGSYVVQEVAGSLVPLFGHMDPAVPNGGHYEYTVTVINVSQIFDYLDFWQQMGGGSGGGGNITAGAAPALLADAVIPGVSIRGRTVTY